MEILGKNKKNKDEIKLSKEEASEIVDFMESVKTSISDMNKRMDALGGNCSPSINELDAARALGYREAMKDMMEIIGEK